jgi:long-chain acyl-CoA synthetase
MPPLETGAETYLAYLPAAHILELCAEIAMLSMGSAIGFADVRSLVSNVIRRLPDGTENDQPTYPYPPGAVMEFRPTCMVGVPLIWDTIKKGVEDKVGKQSCLARWIVQTAFSGKAFGYAHGRATPLMSLLLKTLYNNFGGRMKLGITGGGPISADVQRFLSVAMGFPLIQGYALTETACAGTVQNTCDPDSGTVGGPVASVEIKLRSCTGQDDPKDKIGKKYKSTDKKHCGVPCQGRGEVCIRGPSLSRGYFKQPQKTAEAWDEDGWFRTGDVGIWDTRGRLCIVDRLKNLVKLKGGEYISVESMEKEYGTSIYVRGGADGGIMCYGDGEMKKPVALLQVNIPELKKWAANAAPDYVNDIEGLCSTEEAQKEVLKDLKKSGNPGDKSGCKLGANESLAGVLLLTNGWTPENGGKTASNKLDRVKIKEMHKDGFEALRMSGM